MSTKKLAGQILRIERLKSSYYGNPRYSVVLDTKDGVAAYKTGVDAMVGYSITNFKPGASVVLTLEGKRESVTDCEAA
jgi:hypothetical protein